MRAQLWSRTVLYMVISSKEIVEVSEYERRRLSQKLHNGLCQILSGGMLTASVIATSLKRSNSPEAAEAEQLEKIMREAVVQARDLLRSSHSTIVEGHKFLFALQTLTTSIGDKVPCRFVCPCKFSLNDNYIATLLYRIVQESLANVLTHSNAADVTLGCFVRRGILVIKIDDNGVGIRPKSSNPGVGIPMMHCFATAIGARLKITNRMAGGTRVQCVVRLNAEKLL